IDRRVEHCQLALKIFKLSSNRLIGSDRLLVFRICETSHGCGPPKLPAEVARIAHEGFLYVAVDIKRTTVPEILRCEPVVAGGHGCDFPDLPDRVTGIADHRLLVACVHIQALAVAEKLARQPIVTASQIIELPALTGVVAGAAHEEPESVAVC